MQRAEYYKNHLGLTKHPEGGYYKEIYRSSESIPAKVLPDRFNGPRKYCTSIYFLLEQGNFSAFHRILSDEIWHFYAGQSLEVIELQENGEAFITRLGSDLEKGEKLQHTVSANTWFASRVAEGGSFALVGCTVSPGFDFADFEMANQEELIRKFPQAKSLIEQLTRV